MKLLPTFVLLNIFCLIGSLHGKTSLTVEMEQGHQVRLTEANRGELTIMTTGDDPQVIFNLSNKKEPSADEYMLAFEYFCPDGIDRVEVFYNTPNNSRWTGSRNAVGEPLSKAETWQPYAINLKEATNGNWKPSHSHLRIDFGRKPNQQILVRDVVLRKASTDEKAGAEAIEAKRQAKRLNGEKITSYLEATATKATISKVIVTPDTIVITGSTMSYGKQLRLMEFEPHENAWQAKSGHLIDNVRLSGNFEQTIPRFENGRDRLTSRWAVADINRGIAHNVSHAIWASDTSEAAIRSMPRLRPRNHKGLAGVSYKKDIFDQDIEDLGVSAATVNLELSALFNRNPVNQITFNHNGKDWHFNGAQVKQWDSVIHRLTEREIVVSAILLIGKGASPLLHPDFHQSGTYTMANLSTREGSDAYRAVVAFLAERYSRPNKSHGWITHWIVFNEVDYGWVWTNMGEQPMPIYMDTYQKALRLTWLEASIYNPTAEVFISLTHNWDYSPKAPLRNYSPKVLLDRLAVYSQKTANFNWGVAYHPYPQSLLKPRTWEDTKATHGFDTRYITIKNIEVLDNYLHQQQFLYQGNARTVLLSEQGYHTPDYSIKSMRDKAAAIAYTWHKIRPLETIETYHYHRWVDHPLEGGLKVGLRTLPTDDKPFGERKEPAFSVLSALETEQEATVTEPFKAVLGIREWKEVNQ